MLTMTHLLTEYKVDPMGMDEIAPRFCYRLSGDGKTQTARRITVQTAGKTVWDSGWVETAETTQIEYAGAPLLPRTHYSWTVEARSDNGDTARAEAQFETGMMNTPWQGRWIAGRLSEGNRYPVQQVRKTFDLAANAAAPRLYITALGLYECRINGQLVTEDCFTPGWTDYYERVQYQVYDISALLKSGENTIAIDLAEGWYAGRISRQWDHENPSWGTYPMLLAELRDGENLLAATDETWSFQDTDTRMSDIFMGETVDRNVISLTKFPTTLCNPPVAIVWQSGASTRRLRTLNPVSITRRKSGVYLVDFGINFTGRERFTLHNADPGTAILIRHGEILRADGTLYTENLRSAAATTLYYAKGGLENECYEPRFSFYGFRYLEITGWPGELTSADLDAVVLASDLPETGRFTSSHELVNKLFANIVRGQESNFLDVPTDCPQRDERLGWSGDTQVFANVATYNRFAPDFYTKWLTDLDLGRQGELFPSFAPSPYRRPRLKLPGENFFAAGWGDAGIICPYQLLRKYADTRISGRRLDIMERSLLRQIELHNGSYIVTNAFYGDWLNLDAPTDKSLIATAYLAGMAKLVARMAAANGDTARSGRMERLAAEVARAFAETFYTPDGELLCKTQTAALLALHFDLAPENAVEKTVSFLVHDIEVTRDCHLSTGFLGTPLLLPVLTRFGRTELAYKLLEQTTYPGWLFPVTNGATTMWERWNSWTPDKGFGNVDMNSFNHYAYGAVGEWFYETICGIQPGEQGGFRHFRLAPRPGGSFTRAEAQYDSLFGKIISGWELADGTLTWHITVPFNTSAELVLPPGFSGDLPAQIHAGEYTFTLQKK